jgi:hypothetical protein
VYKTLVHNQQKWSNINLKAHYLKVSWSRRDGFCGSRRRREWIDWNDRVRVRGQLVFVRAVKAGVGRRLVDVGAG